MNALLRSEGWKEETSVGGGRVEDQATFFDATCGQANDITKFRVCPESEEI